MIYQAEKLMKENEEQMDEESKEAISKAREELQTALNGDDMEDITAKTEVLSQAVYAFSAKMYENANSQEGGEEDYINTDYSTPDDEEYE